MCLKTFVEKLGLNPYTVCFWTKPYDTLMGFVIRSTTMGLDQLPVRSVRVRRQTFNTYLKMYFSKDIEYWVWDKHNSSKLGDTVLITPLREIEKPSVRIHHEIKNIIFKHGYQIDPVTKKRIFHNVLEEDIDSKSAFIDNAYKEGLQSLQGRITAAKFPMKKEMRRKLLLDPPKYK